MPLREARGVPRQRLVRWLLITGCLLLALAVVGCGPSVMAGDNEQPRLDKAAPLLQGEHAVGQTFLSHQPNLSAIEVILVVYPDQGTNPDAPRHLTFHLRSGVRDVEDLATVRLDTRGLAHNSSYRFTFAPLRESAGRSYYFFLEGTPLNPVTVWSSPVDAYGEGEMLVNGVAQPGDLQFRTLYSYDVGLALGDLWRGLVTEGWLVLPSILLFVMPGYILRSWLLPDLARDPVEGLAISLGLSLALVPLALLLSTTVGLRWGRSVVLGGALLLALLAAWQLWRQRFRDLRAWWHPGHRVPAFSFLIIFLISLALRYLHIRDLVVPPWVDSVHHTFVVQLMTEQGMVPGSYEPYVPVEQFIYHFGFHALTACFHWMTGLPVERAVLLVGQVVNALTVPATYLLARRLTGQAWAGVAAAAVPGALSLMPAYYLTWGRYTQLAGLALLPTAAALTFDVVEGDPGKFSRRRLVAAGVAVAGLLVTHYRAFVFFAALLVAALLVVTLYGRRWRQAWAWAGLTCLAGGIVAFPWVARLAWALIPTGDWQGWLQGPPSFNAVPAALLDVGTNRWLAGLALVGFLWALRDLHPVAALIPLWGAILILATNPGALGLTNTWLLSNGSLVISLFLPLAVLLGYGFAALLAMVQRRLTRAQGGRTIGIGWLAGGVLVAASLAGAWSMIEIVNPVTVLATRDDLAAMTWIREHVPQDALFLVNARHWQEGAYVGSDGGYWLWLLTGRKTLLPPLAYVYGSPEYFRQVSADAETVAKASSLADDGLMELVRREGVTHLYLGAKGGSLSPQALLEDDRVRLVYSNGAARVFALDVEGSAELSLPR